MPNENRELRHVALVGNYLPRECGIATFTTDLCTALVQEFPDIKCIAVPMNDKEDGYDYPDEVRFEIPEMDITAYRSAADFLNTNEVDAVLLQHEFGIFGGSNGRYILELIGDLRMPIITTFHTILRNPSHEQLYIMKEIANISDRVVTMSDCGKNFLMEIYKVRGEKIDVIPHGIPDVPFVDPNFYKDRFGVEGKSVLLTFGLLSPNKGIETVIRALPRVTEIFPNLVYIILGATHPHVKEKEGEAYRLHLRRLAHDCGVEKNVVFFNRFVSSEELNEFIGSADVYITPYLNKEQISSGTLAYTVGAGKAVISTPYWYAEELLADDRGILVPFKDPDSIAEALVDLLSNDAKRHAMRKKAYNFGRQMTWPAVARKYLLAIEKAQNDRRRHPRHVFATKTIDRRPSEYPPLNLNHLIRLTDSTGILQHSVFSVPNYMEGYTTDDNARALVVAQMLEELGIETPVNPLELEVRYLAFLIFAFNEQTNKFRNFLSYERRWLEEVGSEDSQARAMWSLAATFKSGDEKIREAANNLFNKALPAVVDFTSPRACAYSLLALREYLRKFPGDRTVQRARGVLTDRLLNLYHNSMDRDWIWYEDKLAYDNAIVPKALIAIGADLSNAEILDLGMKSLEWLISVQTSRDGHFVPIGSNGFYEKGGTRARFDQQPIEVDSAVSACLQAYGVTNDDRWRKKAETIFEWFLGKNDLGLSVYDAYTGGCCDGLHPDRVNQNQGAESTLSFLHSLLELTLYQQYNKIISETNESEKQLQDTTTQT
jgi:glycosyltransferase involved in cell wall biosynthesis